MKSCVVFRMASGQWFGGVASNPQAAHMRASINMIRLGHNPRLAIPCSVETYQCAGREEYRGITVETFEAAA